MGEDFSQSQRLKAAVHYTVARFCDEVGQDCQKKFSKLAIAAISETTFRQCDIFARDLEAFARDQKHLDSWMLCCSMARHAKRTTVTMDDVKLAARRSASLMEEIHETTICSLIQANYISQKSEELTSITKEQKEKRKKQAGKRTSVGSLPEPAAAETSASMAD